MIEDKKTNDIVTALAYRLKDSNKIFSAMDAAETNVPAKLFLRKTISENEAIITAAENLQK